MSDKKTPQVQVKIDADQHAALKAIQERDGVPVAESVRRAVGKYIRQKVNDLMAQE